MSFEKHNSAKPARSARRVRGAVRGGARRFVRALVRMMRAPMVIAAGAVLCACMQSSMARDPAADPTPDEVPALHAAAVDTPALEPGSPPQPLPPSPLATLTSEGSEPPRVQSEPATDEVRGEALPGDPDIWARMRRQFTIPRSHPSRIQRQADWFRRNHDYFDRVAERSRDYLPYIVREAERRGLPLELALLPVVESAFQPFAYSPARASGLWQFIPSTARLYGLRINWWYDGRRDLVAATEAAFDYLEKLHRDFDGDWLLAVAAYNWGEGNLRRALARNRKNGKPLDFWSLKVPRETRTYVPRWLAVCDIVARPEHYGMTLRHVPDEVAFRLVELDHQIDLALAAELADISLDRLYRLNAGYRRWATEPQGPHQLLIPASNADAFTHRVASRSPEQRMTWRHHEVVAGDTLSAIAARYRTSVDALTHHNRLNSTLIRVGDHLLVPEGPTGLDTHALSSEVRRGLSLAQRGGERIRARRHRVTKGESLWLIARRYGVPLADLVSWNRLDPEAWLMPGQTLELRESSGPSVPAATASAKRESGRYIVRNGDSLWLIARRQGVSVDDLVAWNRLDPDGWLMPGQILELRESARPSVPATTASAKRESGRYIVRNGDSLWLIARRYGVSVRDLGTWNGLDPDDWLVPGQVLRVHEPPRLTLATSTLRTGKRESERHVVRDGENLWLIARRYGVSVRELRAWNGLDPDDWLMPGEILEVRRRPDHAASRASLEVEEDRYVVRNGDSLWLIARRHSVSTKQLASWNELSVDGVLRPGQTLKVAPPSGAAGEMATNSL